MKKTLLIESDPHEARAALFEDDRLVELQLERRRGAEGAGGGAEGPGPAGVSLVGNIYLGRVTRVLPGIQAAFVDIGLERNGYLHAGDAAGHPDSTDGESADVDSEPGEPFRIEEILQSGRPILVQVRRDPAANKGARLGTRLTLPGRFMVLLPESGVTGISRRIVDQEERDRLLAFVESVQAPGEGLIVRTVGEGESVESLTRDLESLRQRWRAIEHGATAAAPPTLLHRELGLVERALRDWLDESVETLLVGDPGSERRARAYLEERDPELLCRLRRHDGPASLFGTHGVDRQLDRVLRRRVWLPSGGYLVINPTEALVAVDVNTGRNVGETGLEETVTATNLEAAREVARQLRLRDLGGIVVVDFIDMEESENRGRVLEALEEELGRDRARSQILGMSEFGLVEITRKRTRANLERVLTRPCPCCGGRGRVKTPTTVALEVRRAALARRETLEGRALTLRLRPDLARALRSEAAAVLEELAAALAATITIEEDAGLRHEEFEIVAA